MLTGIMTPDEFLSEVEAFLSASGMTATAFGKDAVGDPSFVPDLREGRAPSLRVAARVSEFMRDRKKSPRRARAS